MNHGIDASEILTYQWNACQKQSNGKKQVEAQGPVIDGRNQEVMHKLYY